jgi:hypothetical protein
MKAIAIVPRLSFQNFWQHALHFSEILATQKNKFN